MTTLSNIPWKKLIVPAATMAAFWALAVVAWQASGSAVEGLLNFGYLGTALGLGLGLYALLPKKKKPIGRRVSLVLIGVYLFGLVGLLSRQNIQIEGVFFALMTGVVQAAIIHYLVAKIVGPALFGRMWCGWACWSAMVFDLLPWKRSAGRLPGKWGWLRYAHFGLSMGGVMLLYALFAIDGSVESMTAVWFFLGGNLAYYAVGIGLAAALKDNRAFCKYVCPVTVPLKLTSRFALMKIGGDAEACTGCQACDKLCPMDIQVSEYIQSGTRVLSTECTLCQTCVSTCAKDAIRITFAADMGGPERLRERV
ncbi:MAG: 4Fe-4S binding protein [Anaerolineae bacterium]